MAGCISIGWFIGLHLHWWQSLFLFILIAGILIVGYFASVYSEAALEVKAQPREAMFECPKHGLFRKKHLIKFLDNEVCPHCFNERLKTELDSSVVSK